MVPFARRESIRFLSVWVESRIISGLFFFSSRGGIFARILIINNCLSGMTIRVWISSIIEIEMEIKFLRNIYLSSPPVMVKMTFLYI